MSDSSLLARALPHTRSTLVLVCVAFVVIGPAWVLDFPGAMFPFLQKRFAGFTQTENQVLYSVYSWPNIVIVMLAGFSMTEQQGLERATLLSAILGLLGQVLFSFAMQWRLYTLAVVARLVFGFGGESIKVAQNTWIVLLTEPENLAFRFGVVLSVARIASALNFALTPTIGDASTETAIWLGTFASSLSLIAATLLVHWFRKGRAVQATPANVSEVGRKSWTHSPFATVCRALKNMQGTLRLFSVQVWLQMALCMFYHVGILLLLQVGARYLQSTPGLRSNAQLSSLLVSIPSLIGIVGIPIAGRLIDKHGHALLSIFVASLLLVFAEFLLLIFVMEWVDTEASAGWAVVIIAWVLIGVSYAIATASIWPLIPFLLSPSNISTGYGVMTSLENLGLAVLSLSLPYLEQSPNIRDTKWQYALPLMLFMLCAFTAAGISATQMIIDSKFQNSRLSKPASQRGSPLTATRVAWV